MLFIRKYNRLKKENKELKAQNKHLTDSLDKKTNLVVHNTKELETWDCVTAKQDTLVNKNDIICNLAMLCRSLNINQLKIVFNFILDLSRRQ